jgi:hypothetical protein
VDRRRAAQVTLRQESLLVTDWNGGFKLEAQPVSSARPRRRALRLCRRRHPS